MERGEAAHDRQDSHKDRALAYTHSGSLAIRDPVMNQEREARHDIHDHMLIERCKEKSG